MPIVWILGEPIVQLQGILLQTLEALDFLGTDRRLYRLLVFLTMARQHRLGRLLQLVGLLGKLGSRAASLLGGVAG